MVEAALAPADDVQEEGEEDEEKDTLLNTVNGLSELDTQTRESIMRRYGDFSLNSTPSQDPMLDLSPEIQNSILRRLREMEENTSQSKKRPKVKYEKRTIVKLNGGRGKKSK